MNIIKVLKSSNYTVVNNEYIRDKRLSLKAVGLLTYILHLPEDWKLNLSHLYKIHKDKKDSVNTAIEELIKCGYMEKNYKKEGGRYKGYDFVVYETANNNKCGKTAEITQISEDLPQRKNRSGKTAAENPLLLSTNKLNTNKLNTNTKSETTNKTKQNEKQIITFTGNNGEPVIHVKIKKLDGKKQNEKIDVFYWHLINKHDYKMNNTEYNMIRKVLSRVEYDVGYACDLYDYAKESKKSIFKNCYLPGDFLEKIMIIKNEYEKEKNRYIENEKIGEKYEELAKEIGIK